MFLPGEISSFTSDMKNAEDSQDIEGQTVCPDKVRDTVV